MSKNVFDCKKFRNRILDLMQDQNITPKQIVADTENKISDAWFSKLKRGAVKSPSADIVFMLSQYFNVSTDYLLGLTDYKTTDKATKELCATLGLSDQSIEHLKNDNNYRTRKVFDKLIFENEFLKYLEDFFETADAKKDFEIVISADGNFEITEINDCGESAPKKVFQYSGGGFDSTKRINLSDVLAEECIQRLSHGLRMYYMTTPMRNDREINRVFRFRKEINNDPTTKT